MSALESFGWTAAALEALHLLVVDLEKGFESKGPWRHGFGGRWALHVLSSASSIPFICSIASYSTYFLGVLGFE